MLERLGAAALLCAAGAAAWAQSAGLSGQEIGALVAGATVEIDTPIGTKLPVRYEPDGRMAGEARDLAWYLGAAADTGRWWIAGDELCHKWARWFDGAPQCMRVSREGRRIRWQSRDGNTGTASIAVPAAPRVAQASALVALPRLVLRRAPEAAPAEMQTPAPAPVAAPAPPVETPKAVPGPPPAREASLGVSTSAWSSEAAAADTSPPGGLAEAKPASSPPSPSPSLPPAHSSTAGSAAPALQRQAAAHPPPPSPKPMPERRAQPTFMVANVRQDDVLNVRSGPSADFDIVGELAPGSRGIAITSTCRSQWCPVRLDATTGWVNSAYLAPEAPQASPGNPPAAGPPGYALRDSPEAPRSCLTSPARALLDRIEQRFGLVQVISTCRPGATIAGTRHPSRHASGNAIDFNAGSRKAAVVAWLVATHRAGGTMTYAGMDHIHVDIGPHFVSIAGGPHWASWRDGRRDAPAGRATSASDDDD